VWLVLSAVLLHLSVSCTSYVAKKAVVAQESREEFIWWDSDHSSSPCASASTASPPRRVKFSKEEDTSSPPQEKVSLLSESFLLEAPQGQLEVKLDDPLQASESIDDASAVEVAVPESSIAVSSDSAEAEDSCCVSLPCSGWKQIERLRHRGRDRDSALATDATDAEPSMHAASSDPMILALSVGEGDYHAGWMISAMLRLGLMEV
jgi:hypothetical protein